MSPRRRAMLSKSKATLVVLAILMFVGFMTSIPARQIVHHAHISWAGVRVEGTITRFDDPADEISYSYPWEGRTYTRVADVGESTRYFHVGEPIEVTLLPSQPSVAHVGVEYSYFASFFAFLLLLGMDVLLVVALFDVWWGRRTAKLRERSARLQGDGGWQRLPRE